MPILPIKKRYCDVIMGRYRVTNYMIRPTSSPYHTDHNTRTPGFAWYIILYRFNFTKLTDVSYTRTSVSGPETVHVPPILRSKGYRYLGVYEWASRTC